jgi:hypothetical protein
VFQQDRLSQRSRCSFLSSTVLSKVAAATQHNVTREEELKAAGVWPTMVERCVQCLGLHKQAGYWLTCCPSLTCLCSGTGLLPPTSTVGVASVAASNAAWRVSACATSSRLFSTASAPGLAAAASDCRLSDSQLQKDDCPTSSQSLRPRSIGKFTSVTAPVAGVPFSPPCARFYFTSAPVSLVRLLSRGVRHTQVRSRAHRAHLTMGFRSSATLASALT